MLKIIIIGIVVTIVGLFALSAVNKSVSGNGSNTTNGYLSSEVSDKNMAKVAISGEINHPGDYTISIDENLGTLITMAGGVTSKADSKAYNESILISIRTSFYIPPIGEVPTTCVETEIEKVNINTASKDSLVGVGFNSGQASDLIDYRSTNGFFEAIEDIQNVKGIGAATFSKVKNKICIN